MHEISTALAGIEGVYNISGDTIVHGPDQETHDQRILKIIERLRQHVLTINTDKRPVHCGQTGFHVNSSV